MKRSVLIAVVVAITALTASQVAYADTGEKYLPSVCPQYNPAFPCLAVILTEQDVALVLAEGHRRWNEQLAAMRDGLNRYRLWDEAERLWMIAEQSISSLAGQGFPSREEAYREAYYRLDVLIASGVSILEELLRRKKAG